MIRLRNYPVAYWPAPKVASTSIKTALYALDNGLDPKHDEQGIHEKMQAWRFTELGEDGVFKFAVIREPIERFLGAYCHRVVDSKELSHKYINQLSSVARFRCRNMRFDPDIHYFIQNLDDYRFRVYAIEHHTEPQVSFIGTDPRYFDRLFPFEKIDEIPAEIERYTGQRIIMPHKMKSVAKIDRNVLTAKELGKLRDFYADDLKLYEFAHVQG